LLEREPLEPRGHLGAVIGEGERGCWLERKFVEQTIHHDALFRS
jgi:hypothetical protein